MSMTITSDIKLLLQDGVRSIFYADKKGPEEWTEIFKKFKTDRDTEISVEMKTLGLASLKPEGASIRGGDNMSQSVVTYFKQRTFSKAFFISNEAMRYNRYKGEMVSGADALRHSMRETKELTAISILNNAVNPLAPMGDGKPLLSLDHTLSYGGSYANTLPIQTDLNETSLEALVMQAARFRDQAGKLAIAKPRKLIGGVGNMFAIERLVKSISRVGSNFNDVNVIHGMFPEGYAINHYLSTQNSFFVLTDVDGLKMYQSEEPMVHQTTCEDTRSIKHTAFESYCFGCDNPRAIVGCIIP